MKNLQWHKATEYTQDCFNKWGNYPYNAILESYGKDKNGVTYDFTILKFQHGYIPCHGSIHLTSCKTIKKAKQELTNWYNREVLKND